MKLIYSSYFLKFKPFYLLLFGLLIAVGGAIATPPNAVSAAEGTITCTTDISLSYTGFDPNQTLMVDVSYGTGQTEILNVAADGNGDLSISLPRYSNSSFGFVARIDNGNSSIGLSTYCPTILSNSAPDSGSADTFVCEPAFYQVLGRTLHRLDTETFEYEVIGSHSRNYNAIGYNIEDDYLYGIQKIQGVSNLIRINNKGVITELGEVAIPSNTRYRGDFDLQGNLVVTNGSYLYSIDVSETPPTVTTSERLTKVGNPSLNFHDITYNRVTDTFFSFTQGQVLEIDPSELTIEKVADYSDVVNGKPFGATFSDANGDFYVSKNNTGAIYYADLEADGSVLDFYPIADGGANGNNDGASCPNAAAPFELFCSDGVDNDRDDLTDSDDSDCFDTDGDLVPDINDLDDDNDGIPDIVEMETATNGGDSDNDGIKDSKDLDSNDNGIFDIEEAGTGAADIDENGKVDGEVGLNGLLDSVETSADSGVIKYTVINTYDSTPPDFQHMADTDRDGVPDIRDIDDDNDGIPDVLECTYTVNSLPIAVLNGSFEDPDIDNSYDLTIQRWGTWPKVAVTFADSNIPGWSTTAPDGRIEVWQDQYGRVPSYHGEQHAEINANGFGALYQDISTTPGTTMLWSFAHRGRGGADTIQLNIGEAGQALSTVQTMTTDRSGWVVYSGEYLVPAGQTITRFEYQAVSTGSGNSTVGNFLDNIQFYIKDQVSNCNNDTDSDLAIDALDLDSDGDGYPDAFEAGHGYLKFNADGSLAGEVGENGLLDAIETEPDSGVLAGSIRDSDNDGTPDFQQFVDVDGDGVLENDLDYDNDGIPNATECTILPCFQDYDQDGIPNALDLDSDNDAVNDFYELKTPSAEVFSNWYPTYDTDGDGMVDGDVGANGYLNAFETDDSQSATYSEAAGAKPTDDNGNGAYNFLDLDSDGDGQFDIKEAGQAEFDLNLNGVVDNEIDEDWDGIADVVDGKKGIYGDATPPSLVVELVADSMRIADGDTVLYTAVIKNVGGEAAQNVVINAAIPTAFSFENGEDGAWSLAELAAGERYTISWETAINEILVNQSYDVVVSANGEDSAGDAIIKDGSGFNPADVDPDDSDTNSLMGVDALVCETYAQNIAFEDLKNTGWSDWDYNDVVVEVDADICFTPDQSVSIETGPTNACSDVTIEAESGSLFGFATTNDQAASGGQYISTQDLGIYDGSNSLSSNRMVTYTVDIPVTGIYQVYGMAQGVGPQSDSFWLEIGNSAPVIWDIGSGSQFANYHVKDRNNGYQRVSFELTAGEQTVTLYNREDGARLDKFTFECLSVADSSQSALTPTSENSLATTTITYTLLARGAGYDHTVIHNLPFEDGGSYALDLFDGDGNLLSTESGTFDPLTHIEIFGSTKVGLPPYTGPGSDEINTQTNTLSQQEAYIDGYTAVLTFVVNKPENYIQGEINPFPWDLYLSVDEIGQEIHLVQPGQSNNTQLVGAIDGFSTPLQGHNLPLAFAFEDGWSWPNEFARIWAAYPDFVDFIESGENQNKTWFEQANAVDGQLWAGRDDRTFFGNFYHGPFQTAANSRYFATPVVMDIDGDGMLNIILSDLIDGQVAVMDIDRNVIWTNDTNGGVRTSAVVEDIDFDGDFEILVSDEAGYIYAWHHDGQAVDAFPISVTDKRLLASPTVVDIDDDGVMEIVQIAANGYIYLYEADGNLVWQTEFSTVTDAYGSQILNGSAVVEDLDGDGDLEIIVPDIAGTVQAYDHLGNLVWSFGTGDSVTSTPLIAEFDPGSNGVEIIFGSNDAFIYVLDQNGELIWKRQTGWTIRASPMLFDSDGDGYDELFIGSDDQNVYALHYWGDFVEGWPQQTSGDILSTPTTGDIDGDGEDEILIGGEDGLLYAWDANGTAVESWPKQTGVSYKGAPIVINADDDAEEEIFAADFSGALQIWGLDNEAPIIADLIFLPMINQ